MTNNRDEYWYVETDLPIETNFNMIKEDPAEDSIMRGNIISKHHKGDTAALAAAYERIAKHYQYAASLFRARGAEES